MASLVLGADDPAVLHDDLGIQAPPGPRGLLERDGGQDQCSPLSLVELQRGLALIGREVQCVAMPALLCHKEPAEASKDPTWFFMAHDCWHQQAATL